MIHWIHEEQLRSFKRSKFYDYAIIDLRSPEEYQNEHIPGSINIPLEQIEQTDWTPYQHRHILFHCQRGESTHNAEARLSKIPAASRWCLFGGLEQWKNCGFIVHAATLKETDITHKIPTLLYGVLGFFVILTLIVHWILILPTLAIALYIFYSWYTGYCFFADMIQWIKQHT